MKISVLHHDAKKGKLVVSVKDTTTSFMNALRRTAMDDVPTLAFEDIEIRKNSSTLYDEIVAHRLGLTPLVTDLSSYDLAEDPESEEGKGPRHQLTFTLKGSGPGIVQASELSSQDPKVKPVFPEMPLVKLLKGQKVELEATARMGTGREHVKWSPGLVWYRHAPKISAGSSDDAEAVAKRFPKGTVTAKGGKLSVDADALQIQRELDAAESLSGGAITVEDEESDFILFIESWGQLTPVEILQQAASILAENFKTFEKDLEQTT